MCTGLYVHTYMYVRSTSTQVKPRLGELARRNVTVKAVKYEKDDFFQVGLFN